MTALGGQSNDNGDFRMPPLSLSAIEVLAEAFLGEFAPECLAAPIPLDVRKLVDDDLPRRRIHVCAASTAEMRGNEGLTNPDGLADIEVLIDAQQFHDLSDPGPRGNRARGTTCHELGHVVLHVPVIRQRRQIPQAAHLLQRVATSTLKPYERSEWQAWAFAGCILMPRRTVTMLPVVTARAVAHHYAVSEALARNHLRRLRLAA